MQVSMEERAFLLNSSGIFRGTRVVARLTLIRGLDARERSFTGHPLWSAVSYIVQTELRSTPDLSAAKIRAGSHAESKRPWRAASGTRIPQPHSKDMNTQMYICWIISGQFSKLSVSRGQSICASCRTS